MAQIAKFGFQGTLNLNSGTYGSPTWAAAKNVRELTVTFKPDKEDVSSRLGAGVKQFEPSLFEITIAGKIRSDQGDTIGYVVLETAFLTGATVDVMVLDGPVATDGTRGIRGVMKVFDWTEDQSNEKVLWRAFELSPCLDDNVIKKAVLASSTPAFTSLAR